MRIQVDYSPTNKEGDDSVETIVVNQPVKRDHDMATILYPIIRNSVFDPVTVAQLLLEIAEGNR